MRDKEEHIDKIFRDGLASYEVKPPSEIWPVVNDGLFHSAFRNKLWFFKAKAPGDVWLAIRAGIASPGRPHYVRIAAAAAVIAIFLSGAWWTAQRNFFNPDQEQLAIQTETSDIPDQDLSESGILPTQDLPVRNVYAQPQTTSTGNESPALLVTNTLSGKNAEVIVPSEEVSSLQTGDQEFFQNTFLVPANIAADEFITDPEGDRYFSVVKAKPVFDFSDISFPASNSLVAINQQQGSESYKWAVSGNVSPLFSFRYANTESSGEEMDYFYEKESGIMSYSGGVNVIYSLKKRLSVQTGLQYSKGGQRLNDIIFYQDVQTGRLLSSGIFQGNIPYPIETSIGIINSGDNVHYIVDFELLNGKLYTGNLSTRPEFENYEAMNTFLTQNLEFLEIPVLIRYKLIDKKLGMNVISGLGASFLVDNAVYMNYMGEQFPLGQIENVKVVNFTGTLGLGLEYSVNKKLSLNLEPSIKYFLNSLNTDSKFSTHPYFFGVYSGVSVSF
ncbi:MAG: hypothetical protein U9N53_14895 [Bacteroidota bacterium]|nr:hypothetical protein [Bacteroidota bacterium]